MTESARMILNLLGNKTNPTTILVDTQDTEDIIHAILRKHELCTLDYDKFSFLFDQGTIPEICERLFDFCRQNIQFVEEKTAEQFTSSPASILRRGTGDCKSFALFCGGVLDSLRRKGKRINWVFRFASYKIFKKEPGHVFICVTYQGDQIYIDPVFSQFNYHKPAMWIQDYKVEKDPAQMAGIEIDNQGHLNVLSDTEYTYDDAIGTTAQTGKLIMSVAPALAAVPVIGWVAAGAGEVVGFFLSTFGNRYNTSTQVRWLTQLFERMVLANPNATSDNTVNETDVPTAQKWFALVLGVPVYDRLRFNSLAGHTGSAAVDNSADAGAQDYMKYPEVQKAGVTYGEAYAAAMIARALPWTNVPGSWRNQTAAPSLISQPGAAPGTAPGMTSKLASLFSNKWMMILLVGAGLGLLFFNPKNISHAKVRRS